MMEIDVSAVMDVYLCMLQTYHQFFFVTEKGWDTNQQLGSGMILRPAKPYMDRLSAIHSNQLRKPVNHDCLTIWSHLGKLPSFSLGPSRGQAAKVRPTPGMRGPWGSRWERWAQRAALGWYPSCGPEGDTHPFSQWDDGIGKKGTIHDWWTIWQYHTIFWYILFVHVCVKLFRFKAVKWTRSLFVRKSWLVGCRSWTDLGPWLVFI